MPLFVPSYAPQGLYEGELAGAGAAALVANTVYLVRVPPLQAVTVLTGIRLRFGAGGTGHYDVGVYDDSGANGGPGSLKDHAASSNTALVTSTATLSPAFLNGNLTLNPGRYWLAFWIDNATDTVFRVAGSASFVICVSGGSTGPLPASGASITSLVDTGTKVALVGLTAGGWS